MAARARGNAHPGRPAVAGGRPTPQGRRALDARSRQVHSGGATRGRPRAPRKPARPVPIQEDTHGRDSQGQRHRFQLCGDGKARRTLQKPKEYVESVHRHVHPGTRARHLPDHRKRADRGSGLPSPDRAAGLPCGDHPRRPRQGGLAARAPDAGGVHAAGGQVGGLLGTQGRKGGDPGALRHHLCACARDARVPQRRYQARPAAGARRRERSRPRRLARTR